MSISESAVAITKYLGTGLGAVGLYRLTAIPVLSTAEALLRLLHCRTVADDISRYKESILAKVEAETAAAEADARIKLAKAADGANKATREHMKQREEQLKLEERRVRAAQDEAEAERIRAEVEERRQVAIEGVLQRIEDAASTLRMQGGQFMLSGENLMRIIAAAIAKEENYSTRLVDLDFSVRSTKVFQKGKLVMVRDLAQMTAAEFKAVPGVGATTFNEVEQTLARLGLGFREVESE